jgi:hypothetical protein
MVRRRPGGGRIIRRYACSTVIPMTRTRRVMVFSEGPNGFFYGVLGES